MKNFKCVLCDKQAVADEPFNIFSSKAPHSGKSFLNLIQQVTRLSFKNNKADESFLCERCYNLFDKFDLSEYTSNQLRLEILENIKDMQQTDFGFIDVACQTEDLLNSIKHIVIAEEDIKAEAVEQNASDDNENKSEDESYLFSCDFCYQQFENLSNYQKHHRECSFSSKKSLDCKKCGKKYMSKSGLHWHMNKKHGRKNKISNDNQLSIEPSDLIECNIKVERDEDISEDNLLSNIDGTEFSDNNHSDEDLQPTNSEKTDLDSKYLDTKRRGRPKNTTGIVVKPFKYQCPDCPKKWRTKAELKIHSVSHSDLRPHVCDMCGQAYKKRIALDIHIGMHKGIYPFSCTICNKVFTQKGALNRHMPIHTRIASYQCDLCGKQFIHHTSFSMHKLSHTGLKAYKCEVCGLGLMSSSHLKRHMRAHSGEKRYSCSQCGKCFAEKYNLGAHERLHTSPGGARNKRAHVCPLCGDTFQRRQKLEEHLSSFHNKVTGLEDDRKWMAGNLNGTKQWPSNFGQVNIPDLSKIPPFNITNLNSELLDVSKKFPSKPDASFDITNDETEQLLNTKKS